MKKLFLAFAFLFGMKGYAQFIPSEKIFVNLYVSTRTQGMDGVSVFFGDRSLRYDQTGYFRFTDSVNNADAQKFTQLMTGELLGIVRHGDTLISESRAIPRTELPGLDTIHLSLERLGRTATTYTLQVQQRDIAQIQSVRLIDQYSRQEYVIPRGAVSYNYLFSVNSSDPDGTLSKRTDRFILVVDGPPPALSEGAPVPIRKGNALRLTIAPNPASPGSMLTAWFHQELDRGTLTLADMQGRVLRVWQVTGAMTRVIVPSVVSGVYVMTLRTPGQLVSAKLTVSHQTLW